MRNLWKEVKSLLLKYIKMGKYNKEVTNLEVIQNMNLSIYK